MNPTHKTGILLSQETCRGLNTKHADTLYVLVTESQNGRGQKGPQKLVQSNPPPSRIPYSTLHRMASRGVLNICRERNSTTSPENLLLCSATKRAVCAQRVSQLCDINRGDASRWWSLMTRFSGGIHVEGAELAYAGSGKAQIQKYTSAQREFEAGRDEASNGIIRWKRNIKEKERWAQEKGEDSICSTR